MVQKKSKKVLIICSDFYKEISDNLLKGSETYLKDQKVLAPVRKDLRR